MLLLTIDGLKDDISTLSDKDIDARLQDEGVTYHDVLGTFEVNLKVLQGIYKRLRDEQ